MMISCDAGLDFFIGAPKSEHYRIARSHVMGIIDTVLWIVSDGDAALSAFRILTSSSRSITARAFTSVRHGTPEREASVGLKWLSPSKHK